MENDSIVAFDAIRGIVDFEAYILENFDQSELLFEAGRRIRMKCCFHDDSSPSLVIYLHTQSFTCYGCSTSGDVFDFIAKYENLSLFEVVRRYATDEHIFESWRVRLKARENPPPVEGLYVATCLLLKNYTEHDRYDICRLIDKAVLENDATTLSRLFKQISCLLQE